MAGKGSAKDDNHQSSGGGGSSRKTTTPVAKPQDQQQVIIKCPRCDSQNTKFCYYNNYSLTQPRHFCKTCRRYWTNGGALRNVPIGGGCRKNKKLMKSSSTSRLSFDSSKDHSSSRSISSDQLGGGLQFFQGIDFQLGGGLNFPTRILNSSTSSLYNNNQMNIIPANSFGDINLTPNPCCFNILDPSAPSGSSNNNIINFPFSSSTQENENNIGIATNYQTNLASSIESLSSINQDLHWKLQQQRLAMLFGQKDSGGFSSSNQIQKPQPILFHNLEGGSNKEAGNNLGGGGDQNSRKEGGTATCSAAVAGGGGGGGGGNIATEWFFDPTPTSSGGNENVGSWNEIQAWSNLNQYSSLP